MSSGDKILSNELYDIRVLRGPEAVQALNAYAQELENQKGGDFTNSQINILVKTAKVLSQAIGETGNCSLRTRQNEVQLES
jgi:hypothetical protein